MFQCQPVWSYVHLFYARLVRIYKILILLMKINLYLVIIPIFFSPPRVFQIEHIYSYLPRLLFQSPTFFFVNVKTCFLNHSTRFLITPPVFLNTTYAVLVTSSGFLNYFCFSDHACFSVTVPAFFSHHIC